jgi:hypothetical protein
MKDTTVTFDVLTRMWVTEEEFHYAGAVVPVGYRCDMASIPRILWPLIAPFELSINAPLLHDWLYENDGRYVLGRFTRGEVDKLFLKIMEEEGVPRWRRVLSYWAVRAFGKRSFS